MRRLLTAFFSLFLFAGCVAEVVSTPGSPDGSADAKADVDGAGSRCGNGVLQPGEGCDDGNNLDGDGCSATCQAEPCDMPESCNVVCVWRLPHPAVYIFIHVRPRLGTREILVDSAGYVYNINYQGQVTTVYEARAGHYPLMHPNGDLFGVEEEESWTFSIYDGTGRFVSSFPIDGYRFRFVPSTELLVGYRWICNLEECDLDGMDVLDASGNVLNTFGPDVTHTSQISRLSGDGQSLFIAVPTSLTRFRLNGELVWTAPVEVDAYQVSFDGSRIIAVPRGNRESVINLENDMIIGTTELPGVNWDIAVSPSGEYSVATSVDTVRLMQDGLEMFALALLRWTPTVDVSDAGDVVVGVADEDHMGHAWLLDSEGNLLWETETGIDNNGWRPWVRFIFDSEHFYVKTKETLTLYRIVGRDPGCVAPR
jgi:cysteine-rich repeat protein